MNIISVELHCPFRVVMHRTPALGITEHEKRYLVLAKNRTHASQIAKSRQPGYRLTSVDRDYMHPILTERTS